MQRREIQSLALRARFARWGIAASMVVGAGQAGAIEVRHTSPGLANPSVVGRYDAFEGTLWNGADYGTQQNFTEVDVTVTLTAPGGATRTIDGFFYDKPGAGVPLWKFRFAPAELGTWSYSVTWRHTPSATTETAAGSFQCVAGLRPGFLRQNPLNAHRWITDNGAAASPVVFNDSGAGLDGGGRFSAFTGAVLDVEQHIAAYGAAGFSEPGGGAGIYRLWGLFTDDTSATYDLARLRKVETIVEAAHRHGWHVMFNLWRNTADSFTAGPLTAAQRRYVQHVVARFGAFVDIWEIKNERAPAAAFLADATSVLRDFDPYDHPITTSWDNAATELNNQHINFYAATTGAGAIDWLAASGADSFKTGGRPVAYTEWEQHNGTTGATGAQYAAGAPLGDEQGCWQPAILDKYRLASWTSLLREVIHGYWNSATATDLNLSLGGNSTCHLGDRERQQHRVLQWFAGRALRPDSAAFSMTAFQVGINTFLDGANLRGWGLTSASGGILAAYLHHYSSHSPIAGKTLTVTIPADGTGHWLDPETGALLGTVPVNAGAQTLPIPIFSIDIAFFTTPALGSTPPILKMRIANPQDSADRDLDGRPDRGPTGVSAQGLAPLTLTFSAAGSYDLDGGSVTSLWDFGDGSPLVTGMNATHTFARGVYLASLTVTDDEGASAQHPFMVWATGDPEPGVNSPPRFLRPSPLIVFEGQMISQTLSVCDRERPLTPSSSAQHTADTLTFSPNNLPAGALLAAGGDPWIKELQWTPAIGQAGEYAIPITVTDSAGLTDQVTLAIIVRPAGASANSVAALEIPAQSGAAIANQGFLFQLRATPNRTYRIEFSADLQSWTPLTNLRLARTPQPVRDTAAIGTPARFYRARELP